MVHKFMRYLPVDHLAIDSFDRSASIGGTDISIICGVNKYENVQDLYKRKRGLLPPKEQTPPMEWGLRHEPAVRVKIREKYPEWNVLEPEVDYPGVMRSEAAPWAHCSPDSFILRHLDDGDGVRTVLVEIKTASQWSKKLWGPSWSKTFPTPYRYQIQWYLYVTGLKEAYLAALIGLSDFREYKITRNEKMIRDMVGHAEDFRASLDSGSIPSESAAKKIGESMLERFPVIEEPSSYVAANTRHNKIAQRLMWVKEQAKTLKGEAKALQDAMKKAIGTKEGMEGDGWRVKWSRFEKTTTDWAGVVDGGGVDLEIKEEHTTTKPADRFDIKKTT